MGKKVGDEESGVAVINYPAGPPRSSFEALAILQ